MRNMNKGAQFCSALTSEKKRKISKIARTFIYLKLDDGKIA
jgi:hypothetical protein